MCVCEGAMPLRLYYNKNYTHFSKVMQDVDFAAGAFCLTSVIMCWYVRNSELSVASVHYQNTPQPVF